MSNGGDRSSLRHRLSGSAQNLSQHLFWYRANKNAARLRVKNHFAGGAAEKHIHVVENISAKNALTSSKVGLHAARTIPVVGKRSTTNAGRLLLLSNADQKRMPARRFGCMQNGHWAIARSDHLAVGKTDPLALVLTQQLRAQPNNQPRFCAGQDESAQQSRVAIGRQCCS